MNGSKRRIPQPLSKLPTGIQGFEEMGARWIVFDGIDVLLTLLQDPISEVREIYRVRDWLEENQVARTP